MSPESDHPPSRPRRADARRNHDALLAAARRLFGERGHDVPLDEIARTADVANATLYRHFATRAELLVAVYAAEVRDLEALGARLTEHPDPDRALAEWLRVFVSHVADKRDLALAVPDEPAGARDTLFAHWHAAVRAAAEALLTRAQEAGAVRADVTAADLLALAAGVALSGLPPPRLDGLLDLIHDGYRAPGPHRR